MTEVEKEYFQRATLFLNLCAGEGMFFPMPNDDMYSMDPACILMDFVNNNGGCPDWFPEEVKKEWE